MQFRMCAVYVTILKIAGTMFSFLASLQRRFGGEFLGGVAYSSTWPAQFKICSILQRAIH
ncbi:hypothetical protein HanRHA438_Chr03g0140941 [Helianthus annuus]|nr:hypothetical protein HanRHA438_Chr03g0140941 [Helianthus annuus]